MSEKKEELNSDYQQKPIEEKQIKKKPTKVDDSVSILEIFSDKNLFWDHFIHKEKIRFVSFFIIFEVLMVLCYTFLIKNGLNDHMYLKAEEANNGTVSGRGYLIEDSYKEGDTGFNNYFGVYVDIALMAFVGFSLLMSFYKKHGYFAMGMVFMISCFATQWGILVFGYFDKLAKLIKGEDYGHYWVVLDLPLLINGLWIADSVLITLGVVIGKVTPFQLVVISFFEGIFYSLNTFVCGWLLGVVDDGGTILIHTFGAYFGVGVGWIGTNLNLLTTNKSREYGGSYYAGNIFSILGTVFLWVFWPAFNAALNIPDRHRTVVNTVMGLIGSCLVAFTTSKLIRKKFDMVDIQNATIAGGVAVGAIASMPTPTGIVMLVGIIAGFVSVMGYKYIQPLLEKIYFYDSCGVHNLHGMPGLIGGIASIFASIEITNATNGKLQPLFQFICLIITLAISMISGLIVGVISRVFGSCKKNVNAWDDHSFFEADCDEEHEHELEMVSLKV